MTSQSSQLLSRLSGHQNWRLALLPWAPVPRAWWQSRRPWQMCGSCAAWPSRLLSWQMVWLHTAARSATVIRTC
eukprot:7376232-Pyramimonas_sp.AAC.1